MKKSKSSGVNVFQVFNKEDIVNTFQHRIPQVFESFEFCRSSFAYRSEKFCNQRKRDSTTLTRSKVSPARLGIACYIEEIIEKLEINICERIKT
jgi:hypothetical protein